MSSPPDSIICAISVSSVDFLCRDSVLFLSACQVIFFTDVNFVYLLRRVLDPVYICELLVWASLQLENSWFQLPAVMLWEAVGAKAHLVKTPLNFLNQCAQTTLSSDRSRNCS